MTSNFWTAMSAGRLAWCERVHRPNSKPPNLSPQPWPLPEAIHPHSYREAASFVAFFEPAPGRHTRPSCPPPSYPPPSCPPPPEFPLPHPSSPDVPPPPVLPMPCQGVPLRFHHFGVAAHLRKHGLLRPRRRGDGGALTRASMVVGDGYWPRRRFLVPGSRPPHRLLTRPSPTLPPRPRCHLAIHPAR